jgi:ankyrin repeat protein
LYGQTPVYYASKENRLNIIKKIIDKGVDLNNKDLIAGQTPLFYAAK